MEQRGYEFGAAVYGSVLTAALVGTILVFWVARAWSEVIGERVAEGPLFDRSSIAAIAIAEWPLVQSGLLPAALLALAWAGLCSRDTGAVLALGVGVLRLVGWGMLAAHRSRVGWLKALLVGAFDGLLGLAIVGIEIAVHR